MEKLFSITGESFLPVFLCENVELRRAVQGIDLFYTQGKLLAKPFDRHRTAYYTGKISHAHEPDIRLREKGRQEEIQKQAVV